ncbi:MAG: hypothetical protein LC808_16205 [Actinobacteria bacterium]|nr:hypothetical protein [Actinomycetota bacterium]
MQRSREIYPTPGERRARTLAAETFDHDAVALPLALVVELTISPAPVAGRLDVTG